ncbi:MAG: acetolactate synthase large subunit [Pseudomonadota bacterium]
MKAADLFVKALESEGVQYIFGIPGEENLDLLEAIRLSTIQLILTRHEQAAGFMAAIVGRLTGRAGVCLSTLGPGATNFVTAAAYAQLGAMPMLMITGQKPIKSSKQGHFQIIDVIDMMQPITKYTQSIVSGDLIPSRVREAFRCAEEERPGATHLELPEDIAEEITTAPILQPSYARRPVAEFKAIREAVQRIENAERPLLLIGAGANRKLTSKMLRHFIQHTGIPFVTTQMGKGVADETNPLFIGTAALSDKDFVHRAIAHADLIINVGHDVVEKPPFFMRTGERQVIHINFNSAAVDPVYFPQLEVIGDIANAIWQINESVKPQPHWDFSFFKLVKSSLEEQIAGDAEDLRFPIHPARFVKELRDATAADTIVCLDNGMYKIWFARNFKAKFPNTLLLDNALASMGAGLPSAIAAKIIFPHKSVISVCGDGGFMMNSQELETAVRLNLHIIVIILRDDGYGMILWKQEQMKMPSFGLTYQNPDFVMYAQSYGARGHRVESLAELAPLLEKCQSEHAVHVIDLPVDYSMNNECLNERYPRLASNLIIPEFVGNA